MEWEVDDSSAVDAAPAAAPDAQAFAPSVAHDDPWQVVEDAPEAPAHPESTLASTIDTLKSGARKATDKLFGDGSADKLYGGGNEYGVFPSIADTVGGLPTAKEVGGKVAGETEGLAGGLARGAASVPGMVDATQAEALEGEADRLEHSPWLPKSQRDLADSYREHASALRASSVSANRDDSSIRNQLKATGDKLIHSGLQTLETTQPKDPGVLSKITLDVAGMAPTAAAALASGAIGGPAATIAALGATQYGGSWQELAQHPELSDESKQKYAAASTALATVMNVAPVAKAFEPAGTAVKRFLSTLGVNVPTQAAMAVGQQLLAQDADVRQHLDANQWAQLVIDSSAQAGLFSAVEAVAGAVKGNKTGKVDDALAREEALKNEMFPGRAGAKPGVDTSDLDAAMAAQGQTPGVPAVSTPESRAAAAARPSAPAGAPESPVAAPAAGAAPTATPTSERGQLEAIRGGTADAGDVLPMVAQGLAKIGADGKPQLLPAGIRRLAELPQTEAPVSAPVVPESSTKPADQGTAAAPAEVPPAELKDERRNPASTAGPPKEERRGKPTTDAQGNIIGYRPYVEPFEYSGPAPHELPKPAGNDAVDLHDLESVHSGDPSGGQLGRLIEMGLAKRTSPLTGRLLPAGIRRMRELQTGEKQPEIVPRDDEAEAVKGDISINPSTRKFGDEGETGFTVAVNGKDHITVATREEAETVAANLRKGDTTHATEIAGQPITVNPAPTTAQAEAGNYLKGKLNLHGLRISIENPKGTIRRGVDPSGQPWESTLGAHYGYIRGTEDNTGEHVDTFVGEHPKSEKAYVVDQLTPNGRQFDEPKVVLGALTEKEARATYLGNYPKDWQGLGAITKMSIPEFKQWVKSPMAKEPVAWKPQGSTAAAPVRSTMRPQREHDSILEYLSKTTLHGAGSRGLNLAELASEGLDPAELRTARGHGIHRPFTANGGSLDHAAEILGEAGYPTLDAEGRPDKNKTLDLITAEIRNGQRALGGGAHHEADIERLRAKYEIPEDVTQSPTEELDRYLESLHHHLELSDEEHARNMTMAIAEPRTPYQGNMFGDVTVRNEIKRLEAEKDRRRNSGQESVETGKPDDLFSQSRQQMDLTDEPSGEVRESAPAYNAPYYSQVLRSVEGAKLTTGTPEQWAGYLKNQPGVKAEEMKWIGLDDWLKEQPGQVTRQQVEDFVRANQIEIQHSWRGEMPPASAEALAGRKAIYEKYAPEIARFQSLIDDPRSQNGSFNSAYAKWGELIEARDAEADAAFPIDIPKAAEFEQYAAEGGKNYRELLLKLPERVDPNATPRPEPLTKLPEGYETIVDRQAPEGQQWGVVRPGQASAMMLGGGHRNEAAAVINALAIINGEALADWKQKSRDSGDLHNFRSMHWDGDKNVIAHVRFDERTDAEGRKVLHLAEVQSDWHQKGRKHGYTAGPNEVAAYAKRLGDARDQAFDVLNRNGLLGFDRPSEALQAVRHHDDWRQRWQVSDEDAKALDDYRKVATEQRPTYSNRVPDAPFKTTWPDLAMKRMIRYAAENGFDRLTWDTGQTNADRYSLAKKIGAIRLYDNSSGGIGKPSLEGEFKGGTVYAYGHDNDILIEKYVRTPEELAETIGKEAAERLINNEPTAASQAGIGMRMRELSGLDLEVGGEGMKTFYDKMLPSVVSKIGKKFGASVARHELVPYNFEDNKKAAAHFYGQDTEAYNDAINFQKIAVHSLDITPAMREAAMGGMSVFEARRAYRSQMMLPFGPAVAKKLAELPTRENTTPAQSAAGAAALRSLLYPKDRAASKVLGTDLVKDFIDRGKTKLIGASPKDAFEFAQLAQVYRNPQFETFRILYTKGDEIVHQTGLSARLPGVVAWNDAQLNHILGMYKVAGADGFWLQHNHPSGDPGPSLADISSTVNFALALRGFKGHVIVDNDKFGLIKITPGGEPETHVFDLPASGGYRTGGQTIGHPLLGEGAGSPMQVAAAAKRIEREPGQVVLMTARASGEISTILSVPMSFFDGNRLRVGAKLRRIQRVSGAARIFAVTPHTKNLQPFLDNGILTDAVSPSGAALYDPGSKIGRERRGSFGGRDKVVSYTVEEPGKGIYKPGSVARSIVATIPQSEFVQSFRRVVNPVGISEESIKAARLVRAQLGEQAFNIAQAQEKLEKFARTMDNLPTQARYDFIDAIERGNLQPIAHLQPIADAVREVLDEWRKKIQSLGTGALQNFIENYFPHIWADENAVRKIMGNQGRRPLKGSASFLKPRTIPYTMDGVAMGLKPVTTNPLVLTFLKLREMQRFYTGVRIMEKLKEQGMAQFLPAHKMVPEGWKEINDAVGRVLSWSEEEGGFVIRGKYIMPEDAARILNNHLSGSKLANFQPAQVIRALSNSMNALQLGFSAFHLGFTTLDAMISKAAVGFEQLLHGEPIRAAKSMLELPISPLTNLKRGYDLRNAYLNIGGATPELQRMVGALAAGGGRIRMPKYFLPTNSGSPFHGAGLASLFSDVRKAMTAPAGQIPGEVAKAVASNAHDFGLAVWREMQQMGHTTPIWQIPLEVAGRVTRASTSVIMEQLVPLQKLGVFYDLAADAMRRKPDMSADEMARVMQRIWDSVDNRLGEMVYDGRFWDRTFKDSMHMSIRAVGWNYGTVAEIGGAGVDTLKLLGKAASGDKIMADDIGHKIPYVMGMTFLTMVIGGIFTWAFTGEAPKEIKDYFFPRTGGITKQGTPERISLPSYAKDIYEYSQHPTQTVINKLNPIYSLIHSVWSNEDYFGDAIYNPDATFGKKAAQVGKYVFKESAPFSIQGAKQIAGSDAPTTMGHVKAAMPFIGLTPAPAYVTSPEQMERREHYQKTESYIKSLNYQIKQAREKGDMESVRQLTKEKQEVRIGARAESRQMKADKRLRDTAHKKAEAAAKDNLTGRIAPLIEGKTRPDAIEALRGAGMPAMADLLASLPKTARPAMQAFYQSEAGGGQS